MRPDTSHPQPGGFGARREQGSETRAEEGFLTCVGGVNTLTCMSLWVSITSQGSQALAWLGHSPDVNDQTQ